MRLPCDIVETLLFAGGWPPPSRVQNQVGATVNPEDDDEDDDEDVGGDKKEGGNIDPDEDEGRDDDEDDDDDEEEPLQVVPTNPSGFAALAAVHQGPSS